MLRLCYIREMSNSLSQLDFSSCCRICLQEHDVTLKMHKLFDESILENPVFFKIMACAPVQILKDDGLPQQICPKCLKQLDESCEFKKLIECSDKKLREYLKFKQNENDNPEENVLQSETDIHSPEECTNETSDGVDISSLKTKLKNHLCDICHKHYKTLDSLRTHKQIHTKQSLKCQSCDKVFTYRRLLKQHMYVHSNEKPFQCLSCDKSFKTKPQLKIHFRRHVNDRPFQCDFCDKKFFQLGHRNQHMRLHMDERPFLCDICDKTFRNPSGLFSHKMQKHSNHEPFECDTCGKKFSLKTSLKNHMNLHSGKPFVCEHCGKTFSLSASLKSHLKIHSSEAVYSCEYCGKKCSKAAHLEDHIRTHSDKREFICSTCGKSFKQRAGLNMHMRTHVSERRHRCDVCDKTFATKRSLDAHHTGHTGLKPYSCHKCSKSFRQMATLKSHLKVHTDIIQSNEFNKSSTETKSTEISEVEAVS